MTRTHVHMIALNDTTPWHLVRKNSDLYVLVDVVAARADGIEFYVSDNNVVLVEKCIPRKYLTIIPAYPAGCKAPCYGFIVNSGDNILTVTTARGIPGFPKGKRTKDELSLQCALRELYEETGLRCTDITIVAGAYSETNANLSVPTIYYRATCSDTVPVMCLDTEEGLTTQWMMVDQLVGLSDKRKTLLCNAGFGVK